jgi:hypothetical protein
MIRDRDQLRQPVGSQHGRFDATPHKNAFHLHQLFVIPAGVEPATYFLGKNCSIQLSYGIGAGLS